MSLSRRKFMQAGVVAAACAALPWKSALGQNGSGGTLSNDPLSQPSLSAQLSTEQLSYYTQSSFTPYLNTQFRVYLDQSNMRGLKLIEVNDYLATLPRSEAGGNPHQTECFSLLFTIPPGRAFEQDTYLIEHEALGTFYLFLVSVSDHGKRALDYYEGIVYRHPGLPKGYETAFLGNTGRGTVQVPQARTTDGQNAKTDQEIFYFRPQEIKSNAPVQPIDPGAAGRRAASRLTQSPDINGLRLGMTLEQVLALFPGIRNDAEVSASLDRPINRFGVQSLVLRPERYSSKKRFDRVSQITPTFLDGRVSTLVVGYNAPLWQHVDEFVAKFSEENKLPGADSWDAYTGMETQLKTLKCNGFEVSLFTGGNSVNINYVQLRDTVARQKLKERTARKMSGVTP
jgi:hypothetical protein